jgi:hypothetical protein
MAEILPLATFRAGDLPVDDGKTSVDSHNVDLPPPRRRPSSRAGREGSVCPSGPHQTLRTRQLCLSGGCDEDRIYRASVRVYVSGASDARHLRGTDRAAHRGLTAEQLWQTTDASGLPCYGPGRTLRGD